MFGGNWTEEKLTRLAKYLRAYVTIFHANPRARHFKISYLDAFAGAGVRVAPEAQASEPGFPELTEPDAAAFRSGSARVALEVRPPFHRYVFVERDRASSARLEDLKLEFPDLADRIQIHRSESNTFVRTWCSSMSERRDRAVLFLDPYGMQVEWATIQAIAETRAIDLWVLFPLGAAVNRLLTRTSPPPPYWAGSLDRLFGTDTWRAAFYASSPQLTMFGDDPTNEKIADFTMIGRYFIRRLESVFAGVAPNPLALYNSRGVPIYLLCFAAGNPKAADLAVRIAGDILRR